MDASKKSNAANAETALRVYEQQVNWARHRPTMTMIENCFNPTCSARFRTLRDGRVFVSEVEDGSQDDHSGRSHQLGYRWLCGSCCRTLTIVAEKGRGARLMPRPAVATLFSEKPASAEELDKNGSGKRNT